MTKCSNEILLFDGPSPYRFLVESATLRLHMDMRYPEVGFDLGFDVEASAPKEYDDLTKRVNFRNHDIPGQVIAARGGPELLDGYTINFTETLSPHDRESPASVYTGIHEFFETFKLTLSSIAMDRYRMKCEGNLEGRKFQCDCEARFDYLQLGLPPPANIEKFEETARRYLGPINTTLSSNKTWIHFKAMPALEVAN